MFQSKVLIYPDVEWSRRFANVFVLARVARGDINPSRTNAIAIFIITVYVSNFALCIDGHPNSYEVARILVFCGISVTVIDFSNHKCTIDRTLFLLLF